jgi:hypothetical protein
VKHITKSLTLSLPYCAQFMTNFGPEPGPGSRGGVPRGPEMVCDYVLTGPRGWEKASRDGHLTVLAPRRDGDRGE